MEDTKDVLDDYMTSALANEHEFLIFLPHMYHLHVCYARTTVLTIGLDLDAQCSAKILKASSFVVSLGGTESQCKAFTYDNDQGSTVMDPTM